MSTLLKESDKHTGHQLGRKMRDVLTTRINSRRTITSRILKYLHYGTASNDLHFSMDCRALDNDFLWNFFVDFYKRSHPPDEIEEVIYNSDVDLEQEQVLISSNLL